MSLPFLVAVQMPTFGPNANGFYCDACVCGWDGMGMGWEANIQIDIYFLDESEHQLRAHIYLSIYCFYRRMMSVCVYARLCAIHLMEKGKKK